MFYLYAITQSQTLSGLEQFQGIAGLPVAILDHGGLMVFYSEKAEERYPINRRHIMQHKAIVEFAQRNATTLPVRFNTTAPDLETIRNRVLIARSTQLFERLALIEGHDEYGVRATWMDQAATLEAVVTNDAKLREMRDAGGGDLNARMALGRRVEAGVLRTRTEIGERVNARLEALARELRVGTLPDDTVVNASLLLDRSRADDLERLLAQIDLDEPLIDLRLSGPMPPYTFSEMVIIWGEA